MLMRNAGPTLLGFTLCIHLGRLVHMTMNFFKQQQRNTVQGMIKHRKIMGNAGPDLLAFTLCIHL